MTHTVLGTMRSPDLSLTGDGAQNEPDEFLLLPARSTDKPQRENVRGGTDERGRFGATRSQLRTVREDIVSRGGIARRLWSSDTLSGKNSHLIIPCRAHAKRETRYFTGCRNNLPRCRSVFAGDFAKTPRAQESAPGASNRNQCSGQTRCRQCNSSVRKFNSGISLWKRKSEGRLKDNPARVPPTRIQPPQSGWNWVGVGHTA